MHLVQQQGPVRGSNCGKPQLMTNTGFTFNVQTHPSTKTVAAKFRVGWYDHMYYLLAECK